MTINARTSQQTVRVSEQCILRADPEAHTKSLVVVATSPAFSLISTLNLISPKLLKHTIRAGLIEIT